MNEDLRKRVIEMVHRGRDGHIPSAFSIIDILAVLYGECLRFDPHDPEWPSRDYFILSKGHGAVALYAILEQQGVISKAEIELFCKPNGILGEHPDCTKVPGVEASTGSLGHGLPFAVGIALGLRISRMGSRVYALVGDGECHEGTIWEAANVANNLRLGNLVAIVDWNGSAATLMPRDDLPNKWRAFGWNTVVVNGHSRTELLMAFRGIRFEREGTPTVIVARTVKGKGVPMLEGHGKWHHRIPSDEELAEIMRALS